VAELEGLAAFYFNARDLGRKRWAIKTKGRKEQCKEEKNT
jgi:hypothetical protein